MLPRKRKGEGKRGDSSQTPAYSVQRPDSRPKDHVRSFNVNVGSRSEPRPHLCGGSFIIRSSHRCSVSGEKTFLCRVTRNTTQVERDQRDVVANEQLCLGEISV